MKNESYNNDNFAITGGTTSCHNNNFGAGSGNKIDIMIALGFQCWWKVSIEEVLTNSILLWVHFLMKAKIISWVNNCMIREVRYFTICELLISTYTNKFYAHMIR